MFLSQQKTSHLSQQDTDFLPHQNTRLFPFLFELMDLFLTGQDQSTADQPNNLASVGIDALFAFNILYGNDMSYPNLKCVWK